MDYNMDFVKQQGRGHHVSYSRPNNPDENIPVLLFSQIMSSLHGTNLTAKGMTSVGEGKIMNNTHVKNVFVLGSPFSASPGVVQHFYDQIRTLNEIRITDEKEKVLLGTIKPATGNKMDVLNKIVISGEYLYIKPNSVKTCTKGPAAPEHLTKKQFNPASAAAEAVAVAVAASALTPGLATLTGNIQIVPVPTRPNALVIPATLPLSPASNVFMNFQLSSCKKQKIKAVNAVKPITKLVESTTKATEPNEDKDMEMKVASTPVAVGVVSVMDHKGKGKAQN
ncbi:hypothetical protein CERSUDRAFT_99492 [Gelatoporia subvermispora B]|uniref:Uncharacterized protein n=1 Tax=Ceriporiopsis subvermispora (strain B) TaxID=914234 RepID=M2R2E9_CERS8|nr:hypothetical protein CERSUDRAFT_99492 [Gelatoporia subvermispora B]